MDSLVDSLLNSPTNISFSALMSLADLLARPECSSTPKLCGNIDKLISNISIIINSTEGLVVQSALIAIGYLLHDTQINGTIKIETVKEVINVVVDKIYSSSDKEIILRCYWCLSRQRLSNKQIEPITFVFFNVVVHGIKNFSYSVSITKEVLNSLIRLFEQCPWIIQLKIHKWICLIFRILVHKNFHINIILSFNGIIR